MYKTSFTLFLILIIAAAMSARTESAESQTTEKQTLHVSVHLRDGSQLIGILEHPHEFAIHADFGDVTVPVDLLRTIQMREDRERIQVLFRNEDLLSGVLKAEAVNLETSIGAVSIPFAVIGRIEVARVPLTDLLPPSSHCVDFTGGGCIALGLPPDVLNGEAATYEAWIQPRDATHEGIFFWDGNDREGLDRILYYSHGQLKLYFQFNPPTHASPSASIPLGRWTHVACVINGDTLTIYINGEQVEQKTARIARHQSTSGLAIGRGVHRGRPHLGQFFGKMTDVKVWSRALSAQEIRKSARGEQLEEARLLGHWDFSNNSFESRSGIPNHPVKYGNPRIMPIHQSEQGNASISENQAGGSRLFNGYMFAWTSGEELHFNPMVFQDSATSLPLTREGFAETEA